MAASTCDFQQTHQFDFVPLRHGEHFADGAAFDHFLDVPAGFFIGIEEDMHLGDATKQIVEVAHDVLIGADHENAEVIHFAGRDAMERQSFLHILQVDELGDLCRRNRR